MRILPFIALSLTAIRGVVAVCSCSDVAATALQCDPNDANCLCSSGNYLSIFNGCARARRGERCSEKDIEDATNAYNDACASLSSTSSAPTSTGEPTSTSSSTSVSTTSETTATSSSSTSSTDPTSSSTSSASMTPTNTVAASAAPRRPALSMGQIGGIVGGAAGLVVFTTLIIVFFTWRKYKKIDKVADAERNEEAKQFVEGGRQMRAASMSQMSDRLYSTQRPLSYALGEYNSNHHEPDDDTDGSPSNSLHGNYFNRFSGNHMDDSAQAFSNNSPSGGYFPPSSYRNSQRAVSVPAGPGGPMLPTASLSYEEYRSQAYDSREERSYLMQSQSGSSASSSSAPHRSVSAPMPNQNQAGRISRKPIGNSVSDRSSSQYYQQY
ncbi:hypothetical protein AA313_de0200522 [Arthrobotrys entomopaga]|nr:hypothetical protein AA313_de0200522 [Arthrobotrys entomopaga]